MFSKAYIELGFDHIIDPQGLDHVLFIVGLCALYVWRDWKKVLILATAFTIGHTLTLGLSSMRLVNISPDLVEMLIPITIIITCIHNLWKPGSVVKNNGNVNYSMALGFGLIHGLGFSNFFRSLMDEDESIIGPLLSFNIGVELGQLLIILAILIFAFVLIDGLKLKRKFYVFGVSIVVIIWTIYNILII